MVVFTADENKFLLEFRERDPMVAQRAAELDGVPEAALSGKEQDYDIYKNINLILLVVLISLVLILSYALFFVV